MTVRAVHEKRRDVTVERIEDAGDRVRVAPSDAPAELDAERRAELALSAQRDWKPDLRGVTVHDDDSARRSADSIGAAAYTQGREIFLGSAYEAGTPAGDHVLAHELAHVEQGHDAGDVHRFPATALTAGPVDWSGATPERKGGGVSGGVFFLHSADQQDDIKTVIVKPVYGKSGLGTQESGNQLEFGDRALASLLGIKTPTSRVVQAGSAEFAELVYLLDPLAQQPQLGPEASDEEHEAANNWQPIEAAKSFVVMGEVPGRSIASLADKASSDPSVAAQLQRVVLDPAFIAEVGRLCAGDALLGNNDRMLSGAMNLGNLMVESQQNGENALWAIDTNAVLGRDFNPDNIVSQGSVSKNLQGMQSNLKKSLADRPRIINGFFDVVIARVRRGLEKLPPSQGPNAADILEQQINANRQNLVDTFIAGWDDALGSIYSLISSQEGRDKIGALTKEYEGKEGGSQLDAQTLGWQARLLTTEQSGETVEGVAGDAALDRLLAADVASLLPPLDEHNHDMISGPEGGALQTDYEKPAELPRSTAIAASTLRKGGDFHPDLVPPIRDAVWAARSAVSQQIGQTKTRGVIKKKEVTRNRVLANDFVSSTYLVVPGGYRALDALKRASVMGREFRAAAGAATATPSQAQQGAHKLRTIDESAQRLTDMLTAYEASLGKAAKGVGRMRAKGKDNVQYLKNLKDAVAEAADKMSLRKGYLSDLRDTGLPTAIDALQAKARLGVPKVDPSETAKAKGRKPLIGSRGR